MRICGCAFFLFMNNVRTIKARSTPIIVPITRPFSMFQFVEQSFAGLPSLQRIMSQIRTLGGATMVVEQLPLAKELQEENEDLEKRFGTQPTSTVHRLSFF